MSRSIHRSIRILSRLALCAALASSASLAHAQQGYGPQNYGPQNYGPQDGPNTNNRGRNNGSRGGGVLPLPQGVSRVVGIDAQNLLLVEMEPEVEGGPSEYRAIPVRHVYVGGIARVFGGTTISTEEFVSPAFNKGQGFGQNNGGPGNFGRNGGGQRSFGQNLNQGGYNQGFNQGGFGQNFGPNGQPFIGGYPNNGFNPNGFNPNGFSNGVPLGAGFGGGFVSAPQVTFGVGGITRTVPAQTTTTTTVQQGR